MYVPTYYLYVPAMCAFVKLSIASDKILAIYLFKLFNFPGPDSIFLTRYRVDLYLGNYAAWSTVVTFVFVCVVNLAFKLFIYLFSRTPWIQFFVLNFKKLGNLHFWMNANKHRYTT